MRLKNPEIRKAVDLLGDMVSNEVFIYGDDDFSDLLELLQDVQGATRYASMVQQATGQAKQLTPNQRQARILMSALAEHTDLIGVPGLVIGFKLEEP